MNHRPWPIPDGEDDAYQLEPDEAEIIQPRDILEPEEEKLDE